MREGGTTAEANMCTGGVAGRGFRFEAIFGHDAAHVGVEGHRAERNLSLDRPNNGDGSDLSLQSACFGWRIDRDRCRRPSIAAEVPLARPDMGCDLNVISR